MVVFKGEIGRVVAITSLASSLGVAIGPTIAGILFSLFGYVGPFVTLGLYLTFYGIIILLTCYSKLDRFIMSREEPKSNLIESFEIP